MPNCTQKCLQVYGNGNISGQEVDGLTWAINYICDGIEKTISGELVDYDEIELCCGQDIEVISFETTDSSTGQADYTILDKEIDCQGCTDPSATNYDENADIDDGSCIYEDDCSNSSTTTTIKDCSSCEEEINLSVLILNLQTTVTNVILTSSVISQYIEIYYNDSNGSLQQYFSQDSNTLSFDFDESIENEIDFTLNVKQNDCVYSLNWNYNVNLDNVTSLNIPFKDCNIYTENETQNDNSNCGCTDPNAINYNSYATIDDGSCLYEEEVNDLEGCTDPLAKNYNVSAITEDGSCEYCRGCTDPLAANYDENAIINDGSCVYLSGCTDPIASNYNSLAVIDDGTCNCDDVILSFGDFDLDGFRIPEIITEQKNECLPPLSAQTVEDRDCQYILEIEFSLAFECDKFLSCLSDDCNVTANTNNNIVSPRAFFEQLKMSTELAVIDYEYSAQTNVIEVDDTICTDFSDLTATTYMPTGMTFEIDTIYDTWQWECKNESGVYFNGSDESCNEVVTKIKCDYFDECCIQENTFKPTWTNIKYVIPRHLYGKVIKPMFRFHNFFCKFNFILNKVNIEKICQERVEQCITIDRSENASVVGFEIDKIRDNKKIHLVKDGINESYGVDERLVFNTKQLELEIDVSKLLENELIQFVNAKYGSKVETFEEFIEKTVDVNNPCGDTLERIICEYVEDKDLCNVKLTTKQLNEILQSFNLKYLSIVKNFVPSTSSWSRFDTIYRNVDSDVTSTYCSPNLTLILSGDCDYDILTCSGFTSGKIDVDCEVQEYICDSSCVDPLIYFESGFTICHRVDTYYSSLVTTKSLPYSFENIIEICGKEKVEIQLWEFNDDEAYLCEINGIDLSVSGLCIGEVFEVCEQSYVKYLGNGLIEFYSEECNHCCTIYYSVCKDELKDDRCIKINVGDCPNSGVGTDIDLCIDFKLIQSGSIICIDKCPSDLVAENVDFDCVSEISSDSSDFDI